MEGDRRVGRGLYTETIFQLYTLPRTHQLQHHNEPALRPQPPLSEILYNFIRSRIGLCIVTVIAMETCVKVTEFVRITQPLVYVRLYADARRVSHDFKSSHACSMVSRVTCASWFNVSVATHAKD